MRRCPKGIMVAWEKKLLNARYSMTKNKSGETGIKAPGDNLIIVVSLGNGVGVIEVAHANRYYYNTGSERSELQTR